MQKITVWFNPKCSKCRGLREIVESKGLQADFRHYLEDTPTREEMAALHQLLGDSPSSLVRLKDRRAQELGLEHASIDRIAEALEIHPELLNRPILVCGDRAVVARPPELALALLE